MLLWWLPKVIPEEMPHDCQKCPLGATRKNIVVYRGAKDPAILFVGEAPGATEDEVGFPFLGRSGNLLNLWIKTLNLDEGDYGISNVCRCRPPGNRKPTKEEIYACGPHLLSLIQEKRPVVIITLGRTSEAALKLLGLPHLYIHHPSYYLRGNKWEADLERLRQDMIEALK